MGILLDKASSFGRAISTTVNWGTRAVTSLGARRDDADEARHDDSYTPHPLWK